MQRDESATMQIEAKVAEDGTAGRWRLKGGKPNAHKGKVAEMKGAG